MIKNLRSLIHERFPLDLRVKIELLSRRRDIINEEKQEELIKLLREFNVEGVVQLGPGTNRYAIRLDGFVVKFATDHDGKIDNMKEFKMAKRLYPDVSKVYEVSSNGTIMVAEYIPPFESYTEMCKYADKIRDKLSKIASVYLIGDVGITSKNYANWGIRMGTDDPVCLDFAYVYEVSSELFICRHCKINAMLVPNNDFTELYCSNKACGKRYQFEDIRAMIGNDIHRHEIGDLGEEGYVLYESNVSTELTENRSNYLVRQKKKEQKVDVKEHVVEEDNFVMKPPHMIYECSKNIYNKEDYEMGILDNARSLMDEINRNGSQWSGVVLKATAVPINPDTKAEDDVIQYASSVPATKENAIENDGEVAFSGTIDNVESTSVDDIIAKAAQYTNNTEVVEVITEPVQEEQSTQTESNDNTAKSGVVQYTGDAGYQPKEGSRFTVRFIDNMERAVSKVTNRIANDLRNRNVFDEVKGRIKDKRMYPETFYRSVQNAMFRSLTQFCGFTEKEDTSDNGRRGKKIFIPPTKLDGEFYEPTLVFIERMWNIKDVSMVEDSTECINKYHEIFNDYLGIQSEWLEPLRRRISGKLPTDKIGIDMIVKVIGNVWCTTITPTQPEVPPVAETCQEPDQPDVSQEEIVVAEAAVEDEQTDDYGTLEGSHEIDEEVYEDEADEQETEDEEYYEQPEYLSLEIYPEEDFDVIKLNTGDAFGPISIPFYCNINDINVHEGAVSSIVDDRNGIWDWLIHVVPDMIFKTHNPEFWLNINDEYNDETGERTIFVIMDYNEDEGYTIGLHYISGIYIIDDDMNPIPTNDQDLIARCNRVIREAIGYSTVSYLRISLSMKDLVYEEEYIKRLIDFIRREKDNDEEDDESENYATDTADNIVIEDNDKELSIGEAEAAAIAALMMGGNQPERRNAIVTEAVEVPHVHDTVVNKPANDDDVVLPVIHRNI